jgi:hypothetical protein
MQPLPKFLIPIILVSSVLIACRNESARVPPEESQQELSSTTTTAPLIEEANLPGAPVSTKHFEANLVVANLNEIRLYPASGENLYFRSGSISVPAESTISLPLHQSLQADYWLAASPERLSLPTSAVLHVDFNVVDNTTMTVQLRENAELEPEPMLAELHEARSIEQVQRLAVKRMLIALEKELQNADLRKAHQVLLRTRRVVVGDDESLTTLTSRLDRILGYAGTTYSLASTTGDAETARRAYQYLRDEAFKGL